MRSPREVGAGLLFPARAAQGSSPAASTLERKQCRDRLGTLSLVVQANELPALAAELVRQQVTVITASGAGRHRTCRKGSWMHCLSTVIHSRFRGDEIQPHATTFAKGSLKENTALRSRFSAQMVPP